MTLDPKYLEEIGEIHERSRFERIKELQIRTWTSFRDFIYQDILVISFLDSNKIYTESDGINSVKNKTCSSRAYSKSRLMLLHILFKRFWHLDVLILTRSTQEREER